MATPNQYTITSTPILILLHPQNKCHNEHYKLPSEGVGQSIFEDGSNQSFAGHT